MYYNVVEPIVVVETTYPNFADTDIREFSIPAHGARYFGLCNPPLERLLLDNIVKMSSRRPSKQISVS